MQISDKAKRAATQEATTAQAEPGSAAAVSVPVFDAGDWTSRIISGEALGAAAHPPAWLAASYGALYEQVMHPDYPCYFGTIAERRGEMFYAFVNGQDTRPLAATMAKFAELATLPQYRKYNIAVFFEPEAEIRSHEAYHKQFWDTLQFLHNVDPDPEADQQLDPSHEDWEFSFAGVQTFVVCACPSFEARHSRNLGPGMVLLFQPRAVFVDTITNKVIGREARNQVRKRLASWDQIPAHPDLGFYGDPGNLEWKQYFLDDKNVAAQDVCPFLKRQAQQAMLQDPAPQPAEPIKLPPAAKTGTQSVTYKYAGLAPSKRPVLRDSLSGRELPGEREHEH